MAQLIAEGWSDGATAVKVIIVAYYLPMSSSLAAEYQ
jgi:hypothetical protein